VEFVRGGLTHGDLARTTPNAGRPGRLLPVHSQTLPVC
jgi:hypothetical protein